MGIRLSGIEIEACNIYYPKVQVVATAVTIPLTPVCLLSDRFYSGNEVNKEMYTNSKLETRSKRSIYFPNLHVCPSLQKEQVTKYTSFCPKKVFSFGRKLLKFDKLSFCDSRFFNISYQ